MNEHDERNDDTPIEDAEVSNRCVRVCLAHGLRTIGDVRDYGPLNMLRIQGFGYTSYRELSRMLESVPASARREPVAKASDMTLRDWMAGQAMASINISEVLEAFRRNDYDGRQSHNVYVPARTFADIAQAAYEQADAMLAARKQVRE